MTSHEAGHRCNERAEERSIRHTTANNRIPPARRREGWGCSTSQGFTEQNEAALGRGSYSWVQVLFQSKITSILWNVFSGNDLEVRLIQDAWIGSAYIEQTLEVFNELPVFLDLLLDFRIKGAQYLTFP